MSRKSRIQNEESHHSHAISGGPPMGGPRNAPPAEPTTSPSAAPPTRPLLLSAPQRMAAYSLYTDLMALNQEAFHEGLYIPAYHLLFAALDCAKNLCDLEALTVIRATAQDQVRCLKHQESAHWLTVPANAYAGTASLYQVLIHFVAQAKLWCDLEQRYTTRAAQLSRLPLKLSRRTPTATTETTQTQMQPSEGTAERDHAQADEDAR